MSASPNAPARTFSLSHALIAALALVVAALVFVVAQQRAEIRQLSAMIARAAEPRIVTLHSANARSLPLAVRRPVSTDRARIVDEIDEKNPLPALRSSKLRPSTANALARLLDNPEFFQLLEMHRQSALDARFAGLFRQLALGADELTAFKRLLAEKENVALDVVAVSEAQPEGPLPPAALNASVAAARDQVEAAIRSSLGNERYAMYREYERTLPQRTIVSQLEQRLSYSATPLAPAQAESLLRILVTHAPAAETPVAAPVVIGQGTAAAVLPPETRIARVPDAAINESHAVLAPAQVAALRDLQAEQLATARAMQLLSDSLPASDRRIGAAMQALLQ